MQGVRLRITLPRSCVVGSDRTPRGVAGTAAPAPPLSIIVVDGNPVDIQLIRWVLDAQALPYELQVIDNGDHALDVVDHLA